MYLTIRKNMDEEGEHIKNLLCKVKKIYFKKMRLYLYKHKIEITV